jgi:hypothetical protein
VSRVFLSHSSVNNAEAIAIHDWLRAWDASATSLGEPLMSAHEGRHQRRDRQVARLTVPLLMLTIADEVIE